MPTHYQLALDLDRQYRKLIPIRTVAEVNYSILPAEDRTLGILFEGTQSLEDAKRDLEALMIYTKFGRVHKGAYDGLTAVFAAEQANLPKDTLLRLYGHSLGAMEAALFSCILQGEGYTNIETIVYECPLFGDAQTVEYYNQRPNHSYQNYLNLFEHDMFTMIPVPLPLEPYAAVPNCSRFWSAPTIDNEWEYAPLNIQAHSLSDCVLPGLKTLGT